MAQAYISDGHEVGEGEPLISSLSVLHGWD